MEFFTFMASVLYLQPSLLFTYAPTQIVLLSCLIRVVKKYSWGRSIWIALSSQLASFFALFIIGIFTVPFLKVSMLQFFRFTEIHIALLMLCNFLVQVLCIEFFLTYVLKERGLLRAVLVSNALTAISVLGLYRLLWR